MSNYNTRYLEPSGDDVNFKKQLLECFRDIVNNNKTTEYVIQFEKSANTYSEVVVVSVEEYKKLQMYRDLVGDIVARIMEKQSNK